jgi:hypothetical protein
MLSCMNLSTWIEQGLQELSGGMTVADLAGLYQQMLIDERPAISPVPLSPFAWLCLLLPFEPTWAYDLPILSTPPTALFDPSRFSEWAFTFIPGVIRRPPAGEEAYKFAACLLPGAHMTAESESISGITEEPPPPVVTTAQSSIPSAGYTTLGEYLNSARRSFDAPAASESLYCSEAEGQEMMDTIRAFEAEVQSAPRQGGAEAVFDEARRRHLQVKGEVARSWLYAVAPYDSIARQLREAQSATVPLEHFVRQVFQESWRGWASLHNEPVE